MWIQIAIGGFICLAAIFELACAVHAQHYCSETVEGEVIHTDKDHASPTVRYTVGGKVYEVELVANLHNKHQYCVHDTCMVRYHPENPEQSMPDNGANPFVLYPAVILFCVLFILLSYFKILNLAALF